MSFEKGFLFSPLVIVFWICLSSWARIMWMDGIACGNMEKRNPQKGFCYPEHLCVLYVYIHRDDVFVSSHFLCVHACVCSLWNLFVMLFIFCYASSQYVKMFRVPIDLLPHVPCQVSWGVNPRFRKEKKSLPRLPFNTEDLQYNNYVIDPPAY